MTIGKRFTSSLMLLLSAWLTGCSSDTQRSDGKSANPEDDRREIAATLEETAVRWRYGDKVVLYEQEFEYVQVESTYDEYLGIGEIKDMESDTVRTFLLKDVRFFDRDSAVVQVDVVFRGPAGVESILPQEWTMFYHRGRWIRPTLSNPARQLQFEERRRKADSAARAEENEVW